MACTVAQGCSADGHGPSLAWHPLRGRLPVAPRQSMEIPLTLSTFYYIYQMYWTLELASKLEDAPWPATKDELIDYAMRSGAPMEVVENLQELEDEGEIYETIEDVWPDYPTKEDFLFNEDEY